MHLCGHVFKDILEKGVTRNYNTKVNENLHGPIKDIYEHIGNGKNVDEKVQYFTLPHVVRAESEDCPSSPRTVRAVRGQSEQSEDSPSSPRTVRAVLGQSEDSPSSPRTV